ncbi:MAG: sensor histidine kinase [Planctomycetota bacterium]|jgi:signal transduction histidine kinase
MSALARALLPILLVLGCVTLVPYLLPLEYFLGTLRELDHERDSLLLSAGKARLERKLAREGEADGGDLLRHSNALLSLVGGERLALYRRAPVGKLTVAVKGLDGGVVGWLGVDPDARAEQSGLVVLDVCRSALMIIGGGALMVAVLLCLRGVFRRRRERGRSGEAKEQTVEGILDFLATAQEQKLEALGTLAAGVAHEVNQPLNALQLNASGMVLKLEQGASLSEGELKDRLGSIVGQAERIAEIISHMRRLVTQEGDQALQALKVGDGVGAVLDLLGEQLRNHGVRVERELPSALPQVLVHPMQFEQVLINLFINALNAFERGELNVDRRIFLSARLSEGAVELVVRDNGPGLGGDADRVFDPFFTGQKPGVGMGVGLSLVHSFVRSWQGRIRAESAEGGGACFVMNLAVAPEDGGTPAGMA